MTDAGLEGCWATEIQVLIKIEKELGLYEKGRHLEEAALYPEEWQWAWKHDVSVGIYLAVLAGLTGSGR